MSDHVTVAAMNGAQLTPPNLYSMTILKKLWSKTPSVAKWLACILIALGGGYLAGRYAKPDKVVTRIETKVVTKIETKVVEVVKWQTKIEYQTVEKVVYRNQAILAQTADSDCTERFYTSGVLRYRHCVNHTQTSAHLTQSGSSNTTNTGSTASSGSSSTTASQTASQTSSTTSTTTTTNRDNRFLLSLSVGTDLSLPPHAIYGADAKFRLLGPIWGGLWGSAGRQQAAGLSLGWMF